MPCQARLHPAGRQPWRRSSVPSSAAAVRVLAPLEPVNLLCALNGGVMFVDDLHGLAKLVLILGEDVDPVLVLELENHHRRNAGVQVAVLLRFLAVLVCKAVDTLVLRELQNRLDVLPVVDLQSSSTTRAVRVLDLLQSSQRVP